MTIEPEHILLGLLDQPESRAAQVLNSLAIEPEDVRARCEVIRLAD